MRTQRQTGRARRARSFGKGLPRAAAILIFVCADLIAPTISTAQSVPASTGPSNPQIQQMQKQGEDVLLTLIYLVKTYMIPLVAILAVIYGVISGMKEGKWDRAVICFIAGLILAVTPSILAALGFSFLK